MVAYAKWHFLCIIFIQMRGEKELMINEYLFSQKNLNLKGFSKTNLEAQMGQEKPRS